MPMNPSRQSEETVMEVASVVKPPPETEPKYVGLDAGTV